MVAGVAHAKVAPGICALAAGGAIDPQTELADGVNSLDVLDGLSTQAAIAAASSNASATTPNRLTFLAPILRRRTNSPRPNLAEPEPPLRMTLAHSG